MTLLEKIEKSTLKSKLVKIDKVDIKITEVPGDILMSLKDAVENNIDAKDIINVLAKCIDDKNIGIEQATRLVKNDFKFAIKIFEEIMKLSGVDTESESDIDVDTKKN